MSFRIVRASFARRRARQHARFPLLRPARCCKRAAAAPAAATSAPTRPAAHGEDSGAERGQPTFREGAEVLLTGKASEDGDGPPIAWSWRQTSGPAVRLLETNSTTVKFTAPAVAAPTALNFELTVTDSTGNAGSASTDVIVLPSRDSDKFLSLDVARGASFDTFEVVAALAGGASTGNVPRPFTLAVTGLSRLSAAFGARGRLRLRFGRVRERRTAVDDDGLPRRVARGSDAGAARRRHGARGRVARGRHGAGRAGCRPRHALVERALHAARAAPRRPGVQPKIRRQRRAQSAARLFRGARRPHLSSRSA